MDSTINKIAQIANLNDSERKNLLSTFKDLHYSKILQIIVKKYPEITEEVNSGSLNFEEIVRAASVKHPNLIKDLEKATDEVINELVDTINQTATEEQKQQILVVISE